MSHPHELYEICPICTGMGIAVDPDGPPFMTQCHGCKGEKYRPIGINMQAIQQMIEDSREAHRYYQADGTAIHVESADEVRYLRVQAAKEIQKFRQAMQEFMEILTRITKGKTP